VIKEEATPVENDSNSEVNEESTGSILVNSTGTIVIKKEVSLVETVSYLSMLGQGPTYSYTTVIVFFTNMV